MSIIKHPLATEKGIRAIEAENKMIFIVELTATKKSIKEEVERMLGVKVIDVNTQNDPDGTKHAYVRFSNSTPAIDVATKLGLM